MDLLVLIDKLDDLIHNARPVPLTDQVRVEKQELYDLLDRIRDAVPRTPADAQGDGPALPIDQQSLTAAVSVAIKENIPEIARAVAASSAHGPRPDPPPGAPF
jgi:hypothetical protein